MDHNYHQESDQYSGSYSADAQNQSGPNPYMQPNQGPSYMPPNQGSPYMQPQTPKKGCAFGIAALVVGILSMTLCCVGGSVLGIIGAVLGIVGLCRKESKYGLAIGGIVTSVLGVLIGIYMLVVVVFAGVAYDEIKDMDEDELQYWLEQRIDELENGNFDGFEGAETYEDPDDFGPSF